MRMRGRHAHAESECDERNYPASYNKIPALVMKEDIPKRTVDSYVN